MSLTGARFYTQWLNLEPASKQSNRLGIALTNALEVTVAPTVPPSAMSVVTSESVSARRALPATGRVHVARGPVLRVLYR